jgi:hypothetical protein
MHPTHQQPEPAQVDTTPARVLRDAATYLDRHGWTQGNFYKFFAHDPMPAACAVGAIRMAVYGKPVTGIDFIGEPDARTLCVRAEATLADHLGIDTTDTDLRDLDTTDGIVRWNDHTNRTRFDITDALRAAAEACDAEVYGDNELDHDRVPTAAGFYAWLAERGIPRHTSGAK